MKMDYAMKCRICVGVNLQDNVLVPSGEMVPDLKKKYVFNALCWAIGVAIEVIYIY